MHALLEITRYELLAAFKTRRALLVALLYVGSAILGGLAYVAAVRLIERELVDAMVAQGMSPIAAEAALQVASSPAFERLAGFFAGVPFHEVAPALRGSVVMPMFFWGALTFLPFLLLLTSFDQIAADVQGRTIYYSVLRAPRRIVLLGKVAAQCAFFLGLSALAAAVLALVTLGALRSVGPAQAAAGLARAWVGLVPFGLFYLALAAACSSVVRQPAAALFLGLTGMFVLRALGWARHASGEWAWAQPLQWLSPSSYVRGLWRAGLLAPAASALAFVVLAAVLLGAASWALERRDL